MSQRAVTANGDRIKELRASRGWKAEELADKADLNLKTIRTAESSKGVDVGSLDLIAFALGVEVSELVAEKQNRAVLKITTVFEFEHFGERELDAFVAMIKGHIPSCGEIVVQKVSSGSTIISLEMDRDDIQVFRDVLRVTVFRRLNTAGRLKLQSYRKKHRRPAVDASGKLMADLSVVTKVSVEPG
jgi:transcriptional regulator with XRE-family HTH domain